MRKLITSLFAVFCLSISICSFAKDSPEPLEKNKLGVWITVFSEEKVLYSEENMDMLIETCKKTGIDHIYLQVYRADKAYYNSSITERTAFDNIVGEYGKDPIPVLLEKARKNNIAIHAWLNMFSIAQNTDSNILKKFGDSAITKDQYGRSAMPEKKKDPLDKYYIREKQIFLEPGDTRVRKYLFSIAKEVLDRYPDFNGIHLDYIRYPAAVPFIPGSRFTTHGITYGYTKKNLNGFEQATGLNAKAMSPSRENFMSWDTWKRDQVTAMVRTISKMVKTYHPDMKISATIVPSIERTYLTTFQNWTLWLREGYTDYVVAMDYTDDTRLMYMNAASILISGLEGKVHIGLGAYLLNKKPDILKKQISLAKELPSGGIAIFSYDDIAKDKDLQNFLREQFAD